MSPIRADTSARAAATLPAGRRSSSIWESGSMERCGLSGVQGVKNTPLISVVLGQQGLSGSPNNWSLATRPPVATFPVGIAMVVTMKVTPTAPPSPQVLLIAEIT